MQCGWLLWLQTVDEQYHREDFDGYIDLGRELSVLHSMLEECLPNMTEVRQLLLLVLKPGFGSASELQCSFNDSPGLDASPSQVPSQQCW